MVSSVVKSVGITVTLLELVIPTQLRLTKLGSTVEVTVTVHTISIASPITPREMSGSKNVLGVGAKNQQSHYCTKVHYINCKKIS